MAAAGTQRLTAIAAQVCLSGLSPSLAAQFHLAVWEPAHVGLVYLGCTPGLEQTNPDSSYDAINVDDANIHELEETQLSSVMPISLPAG